MFQRKFLILIFLCILIFSENTFAQWSFSLGPGLSSYSGDISGSKLNSVRTAINGEIWYQISSSIHAKVGSSLYQVYAEDIHPDRNRAFRANHYDAYLGVVYTPIPFLKVSPYFSAGIGITKVDPAHKVPLIGSDGFWWLNSSKWLPDGQPIPSPALIYPIGIGFKLKLSEKFSLLIDGTLRFTNTDMLDGVGSSEIIVAQIDGVGRRYFETIRANGLSDSDIFGNGNPDAGDSYGIFSIKLQYSIGNLFSNKFDNFRGKIKCPTYE